MAEHSTGQKNWFIRLITSSIGQKVLMALTGLFLILFLLVHLIGNLQLMYMDEGKAFNEYAQFMAHNPFIKGISFFNFAFISMHAIVGTALWIYNRSARGSQGYAMQKLRTGHTTSGFAKNMWYLGVIILVFLLIHLYQFWFKTHNDGLTTVKYTGEEIGNLFEQVKLVFTDLPFVIFYVLCMVVLAFHLWHGFQSAFQTFGLNHSKYNGLIHFLGKAYSVLVPLGFAAIPIFYYWRYA